MRVFNILTNSRRSFVRPPNSEKNELPFSTAIAMLAAFFTLSGGLWHLGYWSTFNFNYFEYANYADLFKSSLYPFFTSTWFFFGISIFFFGYLYFFITFYLHNKHLIPKAFKYKGLSKGDTIFLDIVIAVSLFLSGLLLIFIRPIYMWDILPYSISTGVIAIAIRHQFLSNIIKNSYLRASVLLLLIAMPFFNFFNGKSLSLGVIKGYKANIVTRFNSSDSLLNKLVIGRPLLAISSEYFFLYNGKTRRTKYAASQDILIIKKSIVNNYTSTLEYYYPEAKFNKGDYYDSLRGNKSFDSLKIEIDTVSKW